MRISNFFAALPVVLALAACGGGGSDSADAGTVPPAGPAGPEAFLENFSRYLKTGETAQFAVSGACVGAAVITNSPATTRESFEGTARLFSVTRLVATLQAPPPNLAYPAPTEACSLGNIDFTRRNYFTDGYVPIGVAYNNGDYLVPGYTAAGLPAVVRTGDAARLVEYVWYADSGKTMRRGYGTVDYAVSSVSGTAMAGSLVSNYYTDPGFKQVGETMSYRYDSSAGLRLESVTYQYLNGSVLQLQRL